MTGSNRRPPASTQRRGCVPSYTWVGVTGEEPPTNTIHVSGIDSEEGHGTPAVYESANEEWLFDGYMQALERFQQAVQRGDVPEPAKKSFLSLFETLEWAASLIEKLLKPKSATKGKPLEEKVSVMQGVRYVRNRLHHQWAFALRGRDVPQPIVVRATGGSRVIGPVVVFDWFWKPLQELPPPDQGQPDDPLGQTSYERHLAEQPARCALEEIRRVIDHRRDAG